MQVDYLFIYLPEYFLQMTSHRNNLTLDYFSYSHSPCHQYILQTLQKF